MSSPSPFSRTNHKLQIAWDATSLSVLMTCPRKYQYVILQNWRTPGNIDTDYGGFYASAVEVYKKRIAGGASGESAAADAIKYVLEATWPLGGEPWGGSWDGQWRCTGTEPYRNKAGNRAKCPWSHAGHWYPAPAPDTCGECGSPTELEQRWVSDDHAKDRRTLVRLVTWYCLEQADNPDGLQPYVFPNGTPAVELSFSCPSGFRTMGGEHILFAGHLDSISTYGAEIFITDNKTTKHMLGDTYFLQYNPNVQVSFYNLVGSILWPQLNLRGLLIEAAQTLVSGAEFAVRPIYQTEVQREEFYQEVGWWVKQAERFAAEDYWPMNRSACYLCGFKKVCSVEPAKRQNVLETNFVKQAWNPLEVRE